MANKREFVNYQIKDRVATVVVDRPPVNALNSQVEEEIGKVFEELALLEEVSAVIFTGGGEKAFIAGADIEMLSTKTPQGAYEMSSFTKGVLLKIQTFDRVVIAAINGLALGGGCEFAMACDIRVMDESTIIGLPEVSLGLLPGAGGTQRLPRLVGPGKAKELILTGDPIDANEAKAIGLIERIAPKGKAVSEAISLAKRILQRGPVAVMNSKKAINASITMTFEEGLKRETELFSALFETQDTKEGVSAFLEKRKPNFIGR
jgi:enoyl-CoA hydratase